jgi:hypothetical protein
MLNMKAHIRIFLILTLLISTALFSGCGGQNGYTLAGENLSKGDVVRQEMKMTVTNGEVIYAIPDQEAVKGVFEMDIALLTENEVLDTDGNGMTKVKVNILRSTNEFSMDVAGEEHKETERDPLDGKTIIGRKESGLWKFSLQSGQPSTEEAGALEEFGRLYSMNDWGYPSHQVAVGESFDLPESMIMKMMGPDIADVSGSGSSTLQEVVGYNNKQHALIMGAMKMKGVDPESDLNMELSLQGQHYRDLEDFLDVDAVYKGQIKYSGDQVVEGITMSMTMRGPISVTTTQSIR